MQWRPSQLASKKDFLQRNDMSGVTWCWIHQATGEGQQNTVSLISLLCGAAMQSCPAISEMVEFTRLTRWLSPHQGNCGNSRAEQRPQWGEEMCKRPRRLGQDQRSQGRVVLASPRQRLQQNNLCSLGQLHSKNCPPSLTIAPLSVSSKRRRTELFSNNFSLTKFHQKK